MAGATLGVNSYGSSTSGYIYVADRTAAWETGYAINGSAHAAFDVYTEAGVSTAAAAPSPAAAMVPTGAVNTSTAAPDYSAASSQAVWTAYWDQTSGNVNICRGDTGWQRW